MRCFLRHNNLLSLLLFVTLALAVITSNRVVALSADSAPSNRDTVSLGRENAFDSSGGNAHRADPGHGAFGVGTPKIVFGSVRNSGNHDIFLREFDGTPGNGSSCD